MPTPKSGAHTAIVLVPGNAGPSAPRGGPPAQDLDSFYAAADSSEESESEESEEESEEEEEEEEGSEAEESEDESEEGEKIEDEEKEDKRSAHVDDDLPSRVETPEHPSHLAATATPPEMAGGDAVWGSSPHS